MKIKSYVKIIIDILMTFLMIACMSGLMAGELIHEVFGSVMTVLFLLHNILNWKWYANLLKGKCSAFRIVWGLINILSLASLFAQGVSGIVLSNHLYTFFKIEAGFSLARTIHLACGYWSLIFVLLHLGFHWSVIIGKVGLNKITNIFFVWTCRIFTVTICIYGLYAFIKNQLWNYMFLITYFAFFDFEQPMALFYIEYVCIMVLFGTVGFYIKRFLHFGRNDSK